MNRNAIINILKSLKNNKTAQIGLVIFFFCVGIYVIVSFDFPEARTFIRANRTNAALISIGIYFLLGFTFLPASPLTLFLAVFLGPFETVVVATIGNTLAAIIEYQIGVTVGDVFNFEANMKNLPFGLGNLPITSPYLLMAGRLLPLGKRGFSIVCGAYHVPLGRYLWTSVLMYMINASVLVVGAVGLSRLF